LIASGRLWLFTGFVTRLIRRVALVEQELLTLPEHLSSPPMCMFCRSLFVLLSLFFWPLCCLFFEVWFLITSFTSSNLLQENTSIYEHHSVSKSSHDMARHVYIVIFNHFVSLLYYLEILCLTIVPLVSDFRKWLITYHNNYSKQPKL